MQLLFANPIDAVFLRNLAWEYHVAGNKYVFKDAKKQFNLARYEIGLPPASGGRPDEYLQKLRESQDANGNKHVLYQPDPSSSSQVKVFMPADNEWQTEWRLLNLTPHNQVRKLSDMPITNGDIFTNKPYMIKLRDPAAYPLEVIVGNPKDQDFADASKGRTGVYFINDQNGLYIGETREGEIRFRQHAISREKKGIKIEWGIFISLWRNNGNFGDYFDYNPSLDTIHVAESLLISHFGEICTITNQNRGHDRKPDFVFLQQGILLAKSAAATLIWVVRKLREQKYYQQINLPFKSFNNPNWRKNCYLDVPME